MNNSHIDRKLTPEQVKAEFGATHYAATTDGEPGLYYRYNPETPYRLEYLTFFDTWQASSISGYPDSVTVALERMVEID